MFRATIVLFFLILLLGCHQEPREIKPAGPKSPPPTNKQEEQPNSEFKNLHYVIYEEGKMKWEIWAEKAKVFKGNQIKMANIKVCSEPQKGFCISARKASYQPEAGSFLFQGQVVLKATGQGVLKTDRLAYLPKREVLRTETKVEIDKQGLIVKGKGFVYDLRSGVMKVLHQTEVRVDG